MGWVQRMRRDGDVTDHQEETMSGWRNFNDLRAPLMMLYVFAFCGGRMSGIPLWVLLGFMAPAIGGLAFWFERGRLRGLLSVSPVGALVGVGAAVGLYAFFRISMELLGGALMASSLAGDGSVPAFFAELVRMRRHASVLHPAVAGIAGGFLLGVFEELFWRGFLQARMTRMMPRPLAVLLAALFYGGFYAIFLGMVAAAAATVCGVVWGFLTLRLRSLVPAMIGHGLLFVLALWILPLF